LNPGAAFAHFRDHGLDQALVRTQDVDSQPGSPQRSYIPLGDRWDVDVVRMEEVFIV
jgi:hypothetical protein